MGNVIEFRNVVKAYGNVQALRDISFRIPKNCIASIVGSNGAGKTTTLKIAYGVIRRDFGEVEVLGLDPWTNHEELRKYVSFLPENPQFPPVRCRDILKHIAILKGIRSVEKELRRVARSADIESVLDIKASKLSAGYRRRLALAITLIGDSKLLILDEPLSNLDPLARVNAMKMLRALRRDYGIDIFILTQILAEAQEYVDYLVIISKGVILTEGDVASLARKLRESMRVRFRVPRGVVLKNIIKELLDAYDLKGFEVLDDELELVVDVEKFNDIRQFLEERGFKFIEERSRNLTELYEKLVGG